MAQRSVLVNLADWTKLSALIAAEQPSLPTLCHSMEIISPETNADGTRVDVTMDLVNKDPAVRLLKEEGHLFDNQLRSNNISTLDKLIRIVDGSSVAGVVTTGKARVILTYA